MKKIKNCLYIITLFTILTMCLINYRLVNESLLYSFSIWITKIFPSLFPFFIISSLLINYNFVQVIAFIFKPLMKLFKINSNCAFVMVFSLLSGFPSSAQYIKELIDKKLITAKDASKSLTFCHFSNPLFILTMSSFLFNNPKYPIIIIIAHYMSNILIGLLFRNYSPSYNSLKNYSILELSFFSAFFKAIKDTINTLLLLLGIVSSFIVIGTLLTIYSDNELFNNIVKGILEITQGINGLQRLSLNFKIYLMVAFLSFGGLSVFFQIKSILSELTERISLKPYIIARIIHVILSIIITYFLLKL